MVCPVCDGSGVETIVATYNSNWYGKKEQEVTSPCRRCGGNKTINDSTRFQESSFEQQTEHISRDLDDGIEK